MTATTTDGERLFKAGMRAYQQGDYDQAIATLSKLSRSSSRTYRLKAGMGLVRTYMAQKNWAKAETLCEKLHQSSKPAVQQWAQTTLIKIESRRPSGQKNTSGFQPLVPAPSVSVLSVPEPLLPLPANPPKKGPVLDVSDRELRLQDSMFHADYLNGGVTTDPTAEPDDVVSAPENPGSSQGCEWVNAGRLKQGRSLGKMKRSQLWAAQLGGGATFYFLLRYLLLSAIDLINQPLRFFDRLLPFWVRQIPLDARALSWRLLILLSVLAIASPWLWDLWLRFTAGRQAFSAQALRIHSPEAATLLGKRCHQCGWPFPTLWKLPTEVPLIFSYGWLPRNARLVVSEGLLTQLEADEIATLVAYELSHWKSGYWPLLSLQGLVLQVFHQLYWQLALWGNHQPKYLGVPAGVVAALSYGVFWLARIPGLWVSRVRTYYGDRTATELTGNPNGLTRALAKLSFGLAASVERQGYTPAMLESVALLLPVAPDLARYRFYGSLPLAQLFAWDSLNPLRTWMSVSDAHPPLGDRLRLVMAYAQHWKLGVEIDLPASPRRRQGLSQNDWVGLMRQATPFIGLVIGLVIGTALWIVGAIAHQFEFAMLDWMHQDIGLFQCCILLGLAIGTMLRINRFFPDLSMKMPPTQDLPLWVSDPSLLPVSSLQAKLSGTLLGRPGLANWLGQDLILKTAFGLHKLHAFSAFGPLGNMLGWLGLGGKMTSAIGLSVQVLGWFRRGNQPWLDIDRVRLSSGIILQAGHPIFSLGIATISSGLGLWLLIQNNG